MSSDTIQRKYRMTREQEQKLIKWLSEAEPYSEEDIVALPFGKSHDEKRMRATIAKNALENKQILD